MHLPDEPPNLTLNEQNRQKSTGLKGYSTEMKLFNTLLKMHSTLSQSHFI